MDRDDLGTSIGEMTLMLDGMHFSRPFKDPLFWDMYDQDIAYQENLPVDDGNLTALNGSPLESDGILDLFR